MIIPSAKYLLKDFQSKIKQIRGILDLSTTDLGEHIGVTRQTISNIETGGGPLSLSNGISLSVAFDFLTEQDPIKRRRIMSSVMVAEPDILFELLQLSQGKSLKELDSLSVCWMHSLLPISNEEWQATQMSLSEYVQYSRTVKCFWDVYGASSFGFSLFWKEISATSKSPIYLWRREKELLAEAIRVRDAKTEKKAAAMMQTSQMEYKGWDCRSEVAGFYPSLLAYVRERKLSPQECVVVTSDIAVAQQAYKDGVGVLLLNRDGCLIRPEAYLEMVAKLPAPQMTLDGEDAFLSSWEKRYE
jgi:DNA-binding XRE family transcriptional regulator